MRIAAAILGLFLLAAPVSARIDPGSFPSLAFRQHPGAQLPLDAQLSDSGGRPTSLGKALAGRPAVFVLEYLRCKNLCSLVLSGAVRAVSAAGLTPGRDVDLIALSIDPRDSASDIAAAQTMYARRFSNPVAAAAGVRFFTASPDQVRRIASAVGFAYRYDRASDQFAHPGGFVVTTPDGRISRYMLGLNPQPALVREAVAEAAKEKVEPPAHPFLCLCFGYDPDEGSVAALTLRLVRYASLALVLALAALLGLLSLRRRSV
ncbi:MAG TPA: SCO family protein [Sphingomicrobium sp.]|nr:SCO family protein [Sphingomicrobium sp.]